MRRNLVWMTAAIGTVALTVVVNLRPVPVPAAPGPVRLTGQISETGGTETSLVVVPPRVIVLYEDPAQTPDPGLEESDDAADSVDDAPIDPVGNDSADSVDD